jgi:Tol biopolymer transport system component
MSNLVAPAFSPDGSLVAIPFAEDGETRPPTPDRIGIWNVESRENIATFDGGGAPLWSPDGHYLAFSNQLWDAGMSCR